MNRTEGRTTVLTHESLAAAQRGIHYLARLPARVPPGSVLVHNNVRPTRRLGSRGFRAWLSPAASARGVRCRCGWAPELGAHFTTAQSS
jgi:hypothetical protein